MFQNAVSFGKKFPISATATHYDPFTTMSYGGSGTTASALGNLIDTATVEVKSAEKKVAIRISHILDPACAGYERPKARTR